MIDADTLYDCNEVIRQLADRIGSYRFGGSRGGMIPPDAIPTAREDLRDALATLDALTIERTHVRSLTI